jgi:kynurenine formamidase
MRDESEEVVKRRFASLIETLLRSTVQGDEGDERELQATVERSEQRVLVRLRWRKRETHDREFVEEVVCYREFPQPGERDVVIVISREVEASARARMH